MFSQEVQIPMDIVFGVPTGESSSPNEFAQAVCDRMAKAYSIVKQSWAEKAAIAKKGYDAWVRPVQFQ